MRDWPGRITPQLSVRICPFSSHWFFCTLTRVVFALHAHSDVMCSFLSHHASSHTHDLLFPWRDHRITFPRICSIFCFLGATLSRMQSGARCHCLSHPLSHPSQSQRIVTCVRPIRKPDSKTSNHVAGSAVNQRGCGRPYAGCSRISFFIIGLCLVTVTRYSILR